MKNPRMNSMCDLVSFILKETRELEKFAMVAWAIWQRCNKLRIKEDNTPIHKVYKFALTLLIEFQQKKPRSTGQRQPSPNHWKPPPPNSIKVNFDGAVFSNSYEAGVGVVVWNERGEVRAALSKKIVMPSLVEVLEVLAARRVAIFANELGFKNVCFEGDAKGVVRSIKEEDSSNAFMGHLVKDFKSLAGLFQTYSISHVRRQGNSVAHALAREARMSFPLRIWLEDVPPNVLNFVSKDLPVE